MPPRVLVITGPTACGKSDLALRFTDRVADLTAVEIISADSAQVYRGMDIGTAKPTRAIRSRVPHHLIDIRDPSDPYSAADFRQDVETLIREIDGRGNLALIVGGTMLYLKTLKEGMAWLPGADPEIRQDITDMAGRHGWPSVHAELARVDPVSAARIKPTDRQRLQRALEVYRITGRSMTVLHGFNRGKAGVGPCPFPLTEIAVMPDNRMALNAAIKCRFERMLDAGLVEEVARLHRREDLHPGLPAMKAVGYRQVWAYLSGSHDYTTMVERAGTATRQLAKRQYTWLRSWRDLVIITEPDVSQVLKIAQAANMLVS